MRNVLKPIDHKTILCRPNKISKQGEAANCRKDHYVEAVITEDALQPVILKTAQIYYREFTSIFSTSSLIRLSNPRQFN